MAKLLMAENEFQPAYDLLTALPIALREDAEIGRLLIHLGFILAAQAAPPVEDLAQRIEANPDDLEARY